MQRPAPPPIVDRCLAAILALVAVAVAGCAARTPVAIAPIVVRRPVVLVPGFSGVRLREADSDTVVWGRARTLFFPRDGGRRLALSIAGEDPRPPLEPGGPVERIGIPGLYRLKVYGPLLRALEQAGYIRGDLDDPRPGQTLFVFGYDWRRSNVDAAARLLERLEALGRARGEDPLEVDLICHSNAGRLARWMMRFGGASLERAEAGEASPSERVRVRRLILVGTANGGAAVTIGYLDRGRRYVPLGRRFLPETVFTFESLYESLPAYLAHPLLDAEGRPLDDDPFDPATWRRLGWSVFRPAVRRRLERRGGGPPFGDEAEQEAWLGRWLDRGRRFHRLLRAADPVPVGTSYLSIQSRSRPTPERAVLLPREGGMAPVLGDERPLRGGAGPPDGAMAPGDGHATVDSQRWLAPDEERALDGRTTWIDAGHRELVADWRTIARILEILGATSPEVARSFDEHRPRPGAGGRRMEETTEEASSIP